MKIVELKILTTNLDLQKSFFSKTLGFKLLKETTNSFTLEIGWSKLTFVKSDKVYKYHYCFLIPSNKLEEALRWLDDKTKVLEIETGRKVQFFESWNAYSFYFYDVDGNIAEFITRKDLNNNSKKEFSSNDVLCVNEIGMPTTNIQLTNDLLEKELKTSFWKGNTTSFGTNGTQEGLFLLPNYKTRTKWFPTDITIEPSPFKATIVNEGHYYNLEFLNGEVEIQKMTLEE